MVRGPKKHLKRLNAPKSWMLDKLTGVFAPKPAPGTQHRMDREFVVFVSRLMGMRLMTMKMMNERKQESRRN